MGSEINVPAVFEMIRQQDATGVSGTGKVGEGFIASDGKVTFHWTVLDRPRSVVFYEGFEDFMDIHVNPHHANGTVLNWLLGGPE